MPPRTYDERFIPFRNAAVTPVSHTKHNGTRRLRNARRQARNLSGALGPGARSIGPRT